MNNEIDDKNDKELKIKDEQEEKLIMFKFKARQRNINIKLGDIDDKYLSPPTTQQYRKHP